MTVPRRQTFLTTSAVFLAGMCGLALLLSRGLGVSPFSRIHWNLQDIAVGSVAAGMMLLSFSGASRVRRQAEELIGPILLELHLVELVVLSAAVGFSEELLFRGVLEPWAARWNPWLAVLLINLLFGVLHSVSLAYMCVAALLGLILSALAYGPFGENLLRPMVAHAVYDFLAFLWIRHSVQIRRSAVSGSSEDDGCMHDIAAGTSADDTFV